MCDFCFVFNVYSEDIANFKFHTYLIAYASTKILFANFNIIVYEIKHFHQNFKSESLGKQNRNFDVDLIMDKNTISNSNLTMVRTTSCCIHCYIICSVSVYGMEVV